MKTTQTNPSVKQPTDVPPTDDLTHLAIRRRLVERLEEAASAAGLNGAEELANLLLSPGRIKAAAYEAISQQVRNGPERPIEEVQKARQAVGTLGRAWELQDAAESIEPGGSWDRRPVYLPTPMVDSIEAVLQAAGVDEDAGVVVEVYLEDAIVEAAKSTEASYGGLIDMIPTMFVLDPMDGGEEARRAAMIEAAKAHPYEPGKEVAA